MVMINKLSTSATVHIHSTGVVKLKIYQTPLL